MNIFHLRSIPQCNTGVSGLKSYQQQNLFLVRLDSVRAELAIQRHPALLVADRGEYLSEYDPARLQRAAGTSSVTKIMIRVGGT